MKFLVLVFAVLSATYSNPVPESNPEMENLLRIVIEQERANFPCGWPNAGLNGIPPLEPLEIEDTEITTGGIGTRLTVQMTQLVLRGLQQFEVQSLVLDSATRTVRYRLYVESVLELTGRHNTRGSMIGIPVVTGNGAMTVTMRNSFIDGIITWTELPGSNYLQVTDQITGIDSNVHVHMAGFGLLTGTVNNQINDGIPEMLADPEFQQQINDMINGVMIPSMNEALYELTLPDVHHLLRDRAGNPPPARCP